MNVYLMVRLYSFSKNSASAVSTSSVEYAVSSYTSDLARTLSGIRGSVVQVEKGSGVIFSCVDTTMYIVTSKEVTGTKSDVTVTFDSGASLQGKVIGTDEGTSIAVIELQTTFSAAVLKHGDSDGVQEGDIVVALGARDGQSLKTVSSMGIAQSACVETMGSTYEAQTIVSDCVLSDAGKGGPLVNAAGEMIGILQYAEDGFCYAVGISDVNSAYEEILRDGKVTRGYLQIQYRDVSSLKPYQKNEHSLSLDVSSGVLVTNVEGNAQDLLQVNDVLLEVDHEKVTSSASLREIFYSKEPSQECTLEILRDGKQISVSVIVS